MTTQTLDENYDITYSTAERVGHLYVCNVSLIRRSDNFPVGVYQGEGQTAAQAQNEGRLKAKEAFYAIPLSVPKE
jgi:hypothetical protein